MQVGEAATGRTLRQSSTALICCHASASQQHASKLSLPYPPCQVLAGSKTLSFSCCRPEDKAAKKQRLLAEAEAREKGSESDKKKPVSHSCIDHLCCLPVISLEVLTASCLPFENAASREIVCAVASLDAEVVPECALARPGCDE